MMVKRSNLYVFFRVDELLTSDFKDFKPYVDKINAACILTDHGNDDGWLTYSFIHQPSKV